MIQSFTSKKVILYATIISLLRFVVFARQVEKSDDFKREKTFNNDNSIDLFILGMSRLAADRKDKPVMKEKNPKCIWEFCSMPKKELIPYVEKLLIKRLGSKKKLLQEVEKKLNEQNKKKKMNQKKKPWINQKPLFSIWIK